jgi:hypothetical protein
MDINITNNVISNLGSNLSPARRTAGDSKAEISPANADLRSDYAAIIARAIESEEINIQAVETAKTLIESGQLDTPKNIESTAENLLKFGI